MTAVDFRDRASCFVTKEALTLNREYAFIYDSMVFRLEVAVAALFELGFSEQEISVITRG